MVSDEALKKLQEQIAAWPMTQRFVVQQLIEDYRRNREDLRAYKATGLTPEEIERSKLEIEAGCVKAIARTYGIDINRLRKLAEADKDGRLVVFPCKVGDTVYLIVTKRARNYTPLMLRRWCMGGGRILAGMSDAALCAALSLPLRAVGTSLPKSTARIAGPRWTEVKNNGKVFQNCRD